MKTLSRYLVPGGIVFIVLCLAIVLGLLILEALPAPIASSPIVRGVVTVVSIIVATSILVIVGRILISMVAEPARENATLSQIIRPKVNPAPPPRVRPLVSVPACGDLSLKKLSLDPLTRAHIQELRDKETMRRAGSSR